jgi:tetrapyrrole methylase family protein/MazG family protein
MYNLILIPLTFNIMANKKPFDNLTAIMKKLLSDKGCPWDREQTPKSLLKYMYEEADEVSHAIKSSDWDGVKEELGDLLLQVIFQAELANRNGRFDINDVINTLNKKLIRRHPHIFGNSKAKTSKQVVCQWNKIKKQEKSPKKRTK